LLQFSSAQEFLFFFANVYVGQWKYHILPGVTGILANIFLM